jgi:hypothetical protein
MPLRDHFRPPLLTDLEWHSFHNAWATFIATDLNARLPSDYRAAPNVQTGIEIDVAAFQTSRTSAVASPAPGPDWQPSESVATIPFEFPTVTAEVLVHRFFGGRILSAAIELVSPGNKDRPGAREAFVAKCESFLQQGVGLVIVDPVTGRTANLHDDLMARLRGPAREPWGPHLYATAYRPTGRNGTGQLTIWREELGIGRPLPTMPLWLLNGPYVPVLLEETYERTFQQLRLPTDSV